MKREKFMFFRNFFDSVPEAYRKEFCYALANYAFNDVLPEDDIVKALVSLVIPSIEKNVGGAPKGNKNALKKQPKTTVVSTEEQPLKQETETETETETEAEAEAEAETETETEEKELPFEISTKKESTSSVPDTSRGVTERKNHIEDNFNELWSIYKPYKTNGGRVVNKGGRPDALRAYQKALKRGTHEEIKRGIYGYLKSCKENDTLSAMFSTFLNKDYWEEFKTFRCPEIDAKPVEKEPKVENTFEATFEYMEKENLKKEAERAEWEQIKADLLKYAQRKNGDNR